MKKYTSIGAYAFSRCSKITSVEIPSNVTYLGEGAFANDLYLQKAVLTPGRVAPWLFSNCSALETICLENITQDIPDGMFYNCTSLYNGDRYNGFLMDPQTKTIGKAAFYGCERLTKMELGANITSIGDEAFVNCKGLESMTIPRSVQNIGVNGWNGCRKSYCFYVYDPEEYWPAGWSENWNCFYPVHVLGDADTSIFIYEFDIDTREYTIVGVKTGVELSGLLTIPSVHNGIKVTGIADGVLLNFPDINTIIVPKSIVHIGSEALGAYNTPVTVFMESTMQEAIDNRLHYLPEYDQETQMYLDPGYYNVDYENKWFQNMADGAQYITIYYHDYWTYGKTATGSNIPYLLLDRFVLDLDPEQDEFYYDGVTQHKRNVLSVSSRGLRISPNYTFDQDGNTIPTFLSYDTSLFNITYRNNISAGTAYVYAEINATALKKYNNQQIEKGEDPLYVTGRVGASYTIKKATINLFWIGSEADADLFVKTKVYDGQPWTCSKWDSTNTLGLKSQFRLEGTLRTVGVNAGSYNIANGFDDPQYGFRWDGRWYIYDERNNNVSSNFEVEISDGLNVNIAPRDIYVEWTGGSWSRQEGLEKQYYLYPYTGVIIQPTAVAKDVKTKKDVSDICTLKVEYETQVDSEKAKRPTYDKETMSELLHCTKPGGYLVFAYLTEQYRKNFNICDESGNALEYNRIYERQQEEVHIHVTKGYITIKINYPSENPYLIPEDDDYYYCTNWTTNNRQSVVGLGPNSTIIGRFRTEDAKPQLYSTARGDFYWDTTYEPAFGKEYEIMNSDGTNETSYYDIDIWAEVIIKYHTFYFDYLIDDTKLSGVNENGTDAANNRVAKYTYITEGKRHVFGATAMKSSGVPVTGADLDVVYTYYDDAGVNHDKTHNQRQFIDPEKTYNLTIIASRKNYVTAYVNFILEVKKSKVVIGSLTKEYDSLPVDPYEKIIKIAHTEPEYEDTEAQHQRDTLTFKFYNAETFNWADKENNTLISAPSEIGSYIVHATCEASRFFYALDTWETFNITPRTITIDLAQEGSSMLYTEGLKHSFDPNPSRQEVLGGPGCILIGHQFLGTISTVSDQPGLYDGIEDWEWIPTWKVIDINNNDQDVSEYYQIRYINSFRILLLQMDISVNNYDGVYDGAFHSVDVTVTDHQNGSPLDTATIYYSTVAINASNDTAEMAKYWSVYKPTYKAPGRYDVWMKIVADHYETKYVSGHVNIIPDEISFTVAIDGLKTFDYPNTTGYESYLNYDGQAHKWEITDLNPWYAELFYSVDGGDWTTEAPVLYGEPGKETLYRIRVQVRADYYATVDTIFPFTIGEKDLETIEDGWIIPDNQRYLYEKDTLRHLNLSIVGDAPFTMDQCKIYYSIDQENWTTTNYDFENVGYYKVYYKVVVNGYKVYGALGDRYGTVEIYSRSFGGGGGGGSIVKPDQDPEALDVMIIVNDSTLTASAMTVNKDTDKTDGRLAEYTAEINLAVGDKVKITSVDDKGVVLYEFVNYLPECNFRGTAKEAGKHTFYVRIYEDGESIWVIEPSSGGSGSNPYPNPHPGNPGNRLITVNSYNGEYDGLGHTIEVDVSNEAFNAVRNELKIEYTTNYDVYIHALKDGWTEEPYQYTNVGMYTIYARVSAPNYTSIYCCGTVTITQADINPVTVTTETVEYNANGINNKDIVVTTKLNSKGESFYDGTMKFTYYAYDEALGATGDYSTHEPVYPLERAKYVVVVYLYETKNCASAQAQGVFEIVPKKLTVEYDAEVEYNGQAQNPNPRLNAEELAEIPNGENELKITWTIDLPEGETITTYPWDLGTYTYHLSLINPDGNYVLSTDTIEMTIIPRQVLIKFEEEMLYDSLQPKIWVKSDGWENCLSQTNFLPNHVYSATMFSNSSVRATYYLITVPDSDIVSSNIIYKRNESVTNTETGEDVTRYYHFIYDITVRIVYPSMENIELADETVYYDGNYHGITVTVPGMYDRAEVMFSEVDNDEQYQYSLKYVNCGTYPIYVRITHQNYEPFKQRVTLKIVPGHLKVDVKPYEAIYNAATHIPEYQITGIEELSDEANAKITELADIQPTYIKYYPQDQVTISELEDFYRNSFSEGGSIFTSGYNEVSEAGNYYVVVFYQTIGDANWLNSVGINTFVIKQRDVFFKGYDLFASYPYDGKKKEVSLSGLTLMTNDELLSYVSSEEDLYNLGILTDYGHVLDSRKYSQYFIQTNSANSGLYRGTTDFEFGKTEIIATLNPDGPINVVQNYHPIVIVDDGFRFEIEITKIDIQFTVEANEREYCAETQTYTTTDANGKKITASKLVPMLPYPIINTPDKDNPDLFFDCAVKLKIWRAEVGSTPENPMMGDLIGINDINAANVGEYVVMVQYSEGTNFNAYTGTDKVAYVKITPKGVSVTWSNTNVVFNNQPQKPKAHYVDILGNNVEAEVYFYDSQLNIIDSVITADTYQAFAGFENMTEEGVTSNYYIKDDSNMSYFVISPLVYEVPVHGSTYDTMTGWTQIFYEEDIPGFMDGLHLMRKGSTALSDEPETKGAIAHTVGITPGVYYDDDIAFDYAVLNDAGEVVTSSIQLKAVGFVTIMTAEITYVATDFVGEKALVYDKDGYTILDNDVNALVILYPSVNTPGYNVQYSFDEITWTTDAKTLMMYDVGTYTIYFKINCTNFEEVTDHLTIEIKQKEAYYEPMTNLSKTYDGKSVDGDALSNYNGEFNCTSDINPSADLKFEYFKCNTDDYQPVGSAIYVKEGDTSTGTLPIDAGYYTIHITSKADNPGVVGNYTVLDEYYNFRIRPKQITIKIDEDVEVETAEELQQPWSYKQDWTTAFQDLDTTRDALYFEIRTQNDQYQDVNMFRGKYHYYETFESATTPTSTEGDSAGTSGTKVGIQFGSFNNDLGHFTFIFKTKSESYRYDPEGNPLDTTENYTVNLDFNLNIHYPNINYAIPDVVETYTGDSEHPFHGTLSLGGGLKEEQLEQTYYVLHEGETPDTATKYSSIADVNVSRWQIGYTTVYYVLHVKDKLYEDAVGSFTITVNKMKRELNKEVDFGLSKLYDGTPAGKYVYNNGNPLYLPTYDFIYTSDDLKTKDHFAAFENYAEMRIKYARATDNTEYDSVTDYGLYRFTFFVPESDFFAETKIEGTFEISKAVIYVSGTVEMGYSGSSKYYNFSENVDHKLYQVNKGVVKNLADDETTKGFYVDGIVTTTDREVGDYSGLLDQVYFRGNYYLMNGDEDISKNYLVKLDGSAQYGIAPFIIRIVPGKMSIEEPETGDFVYPFDNKKHTVDIRMIHPITATMTYQGFASGSDPMPDGGFATSKYSKEELTAISPDLFSDEFFNKFSSTPAYFTEIGTYIIWVKIEAPNYEDLYVRAEMEITRAITTITFDNLNRKYTGDMMNIIPLINTNNTETLTEDYIISYQVYEPTTGLYHEFTDPNQGDVLARPSDVGKYRVSVTIPASERFQAATAEAEFAIAAIELSITYSSTVIYNGKEGNHPKAQFSGLAACDTEATLQARYDWTPLSGHADTNSMNVGTYLLELTLGNSKNYIVQTSDLSTYYTIMPRKTKIVLSTTKTFIDDYFTFRNNSSHNLPDGGYVIPAEYALLPGHTTHSEFVSLVKDFGHYVGWDNNFRWTTSTGDLEILDENNSIITYNYDVEYNLTLDINYGTLNYNVLWDADDSTVIYDDNEHFFTIEVSSVYKHTVTYSTSRYGTYTATPKKFTDVGVYPIYFHIERDGVIQNDTSNENDCMRTLTIVKRDVEIVPENDAININKIYNGSGIDITAIPVQIVDSMDSLVIDPKPFKVTYDFYSADDLETKISNPNAVGLYHLIVRADPEDPRAKNYAVVEYELDFEISAMVVEIKIEPETMTYNQYKWNRELDSSINSANIAITGLAPNQTLQGYIATISENAGHYVNQDDFNTSAISIINALGDDVTSNYTIVTDLDVTIEKATIDYYAEDVIGTVLDGKAYSITLEVYAPAEHQIEYKTEETEWSADPITRADRGVTEVIFRISAGDNYETVTGSKTITVRGLIYNPDSDDPDQGEITDKSLGLQYDDQYEYDKNPYPTPVYTNLAPEVQHVTYYLSTDTEFANGFTEAPIEVGNYLFTITVDAHGRIDEFTSIAHSFSITRKEVEVVWEETTIIYDGQPHLPTAHYLDIDGNKVELPVIPADGYTDLGDYTVKIKDSYPGYQTYSIPLEAMSSEYHIIAKGIEEPLIMENLVFEYLSDIVVKDVNGKIYEINFDTGDILKIDGVAVDLPYRIFKDDDPNADGVVVDTHKFIIQLKDQANTAWETKLNSDDLEVPYSITPYKFESNGLHGDDTRLVVSLDRDYEIYNGGQPIKPIAHVKVYEQNSDVCLRELVYSDTDAYQDYMLGYTNNKEISDPNPAIVKIVGMNNYSFSAKATFKIMKEPPTQLQLKEDAKAGFVYAHYDEDSGVTYFVEDFNDGVGSYTNLAGEEVTIDERGAGNTSNFYLGHLYQDNTIHQVLSQILNDPALMVVKNQNGEVVEEEITDDLSNYDTTCFGTGWTIELYEDETHATLTDTITGLMYGDVNGDGHIYANDLSGVSQCVAGDANYTYANWGCYYLAAFVTRDINQVNAVALSTLSKFVSDPTNNNFNAGYQVSE